MLFNILYSIPHHPIFINYHEQNIRAFFQIHLESQTIEQLFLVGGYAWHLKEYFEQISMEYNVNIVNFLNEPIGALVEQMVVASE